MMNPLLFFGLTCGLGIMAVIWVLTLPEHYRANPSKIFNALTLIRIVMIVLSILVTIWTAFYFPLPPTGSEAVLEIIGVVLFISGFAIAIWAKFTMKEFWAGPAGHDMNAQTTLLTHGPFAYSRNPIYLGLLLVFAGYTRALHSPAIVLILVFYVIFSGFIHTEEVLLERQFGKQYEEYKKKVPRWIKMY